MSILIDENTTFIIQGITGREAVNMTRECLTPPCHAERPRGSRLAQGFFAKPVLSAVEGASGVGRSPACRTLFVLEPSTRATVRPAQDSFAETAVSTKRAFSALRMTAKAPCPS